MTASNAPPDALLLLASQCPHCPTVLAGLCELVKQGVIGRLEAVNIEARPDVARERGVRSVPWLKIGEFELQGLYSLAELRQWARRAGSQAGMAEYYADLLKQGQLSSVISAVAQQPGRLTTLLLLARDPDIELTVRVGVSAVMEEFAGTQTLRSVLPALIDLASDEDPRVRADACHFLALTRSGEALAALQALTRDPERAVQHVASDSLEELRASLQE